MSQLTVYGGNRADKPRILVIDDDPTLRLHARRVLESYDFNVDEAESGEQGLEALRGHRFDAVLLDLCLPGMDGFSVCRAMRSLVRDDLLPIIVVTGRDDNDAVEQAFNSGASDFTTKPINWLKLKNRIRNLSHTRRLANDLVSIQSHRKALFEAIPDTLLRLNAQGTVLDVKSPHGEYPPGLELRRGHCLPDLLPDEASENLRDAFAALLLGVGSQSFEFKLAQPGRSVYLELRMVATGEGEIVALLSDLTERHLAQAQIRELAHYDQLTGLPNQATICAEITARVAKTVDAGGRIVSVTRLNLIGLDSAKGLVGLERFNQFLRILAHELVASVRPSTKHGNNAVPVVGRVSETGFAIVRDDLTEKSEILEFAESLQLEMADTCALHDDAIPVTPRIGIACCPHDDPGGDGLLQKAEMALMWASEDPCFSEPTFYSDKARESTMNKARISRDLRIAADNGDLFLEYQPKFDVTSRKLIGVEALLRWHSPDHGIVPPSEFIPLAEENGLILAIGENVLDQACQQSRRWSEAGCRRIPIAVNVSGHQLRQKNIVSRIVNVLDSHSIGHEHIEVEVTESVALESSPRIHSTLAQLRDLGITTAIDDFGTGYSSLGSLRDFSFQSLKIDRSFVSDLRSDSSSGSIIKSMIGMAHTLGMTVVAEGVERAHQLDFLRRHHCDVVQGYLTGRPTSGARIQAMLL